MKDALEAKGYDLNIAWGLEMDSPGVVMPGDRVGKDIPA